MNTQQFLDLIGLGEFTEFMMAYINGKIFVGTYEEYNAANAAGNIPIGCVVILTDDSSGNGSGGSGDSSDTTSPTNAVLGYAVLGQMVLG